MAINSVESLFKYYTEQLENTPSLADIQATNEAALNNESTDEKDESGAKDANKSVQSSKKENTTMTGTLTLQVRFEVSRFAGLKAISQVVLADQEEEKEEEKVVPPLYITEFVLDVHTLTFNPDLDHFREIVSEIINKFKETLLKVDNLVPDKYFDAFTR